MDLTDLLLHLRSLVRRGSGQDARVAETGPEQGEQHKQEEDPSDGRYAAGQVLDQEGTAGTQTGSRNISVTPTFPQFWMSMAVGQMLNLSGLLLLRSNNQVIDRL